MGTLAPPFMVLEGDNNAHNLDRSTPVPAQQSIASRVPPAVPQTPTKQRRTVHGSPSELRHTHISSGGCHCDPRGVVKDLRRNLNSRKRSSCELSQFSGLQIGDTENSVPIIPQDVCTEVPRRWGSRPMAPPGFPTTTNTTAAPFASQPLFSQGDWLPRRGQSTPFLIASPDGLDYSQADTEYSNFFNRRILTDYREIKELGCGSFGKVTLYEETSTGTLVAVKVSPPLANPEQRQRFFQEKAILTLARGFPHVVQLLDAWEEGRVPQMYLQMEYCKGGSVAEAAELRRRRGEHWEEQELFIFLGHMALALDALHSANIVHLDFKPDNVLIGEDGSYKLSDFGCSVTLNANGCPQRCFVAGNLKAYNPPSSTLCNNNNNNNNNNNVMMDAPVLSMPTQLSTVSVEEGDCRYLCADMLNQKQYLKAGDIFSFGISLFELMSGEPLPQHGAPFLELRNGLPVERLEKRGYSPPLINLVATMMNKEPTARPTARDVLRFFHLPPSVPQLIESWSAVGGNTAGVENEELSSLLSSSSLLEMRFVSAALEVSSRLVDLGRRAIHGEPSSGTGNNNNNNSNNNNSNNNSNNNNNNNNNNGHVSDDTAFRRPRVDAEESCTPKTPVIIRRLDIA